MIVVVAIGRNRGPLWRRCATAKAHGQHVLLHRQCRRTSTIAREKRTPLRKTLAGRRSAVASTKAFTCQLAVFALSALALGPRARRVDRRAGKRSWSPNLSGDAGSDAQVLKDEARIEPVARDVARAFECNLYLGRGPPIRSRWRAALKAQGIVLYPRRGLRRRRIEATARFALIDFAMPVDPCWRRMTQAWRKPSPICRKSRRAAAI